jgi:hypothetical protein
MDKRIIAGLFSILLFVTLITGFKGQQSFVFAEEETVKIAVDKCNLYLEPRIQYEPNENGIVLQLTLGEVLNLQGDKVAGIDECELYFYHAWIVKNEVRYDGYIISEFVMSTDNSSLKRTLDPNARALRNTKVYTSTNEADVMFLLGEEVNLLQYEDIKIIDGYNAGKAFHKIMFERNEIVYTGYIKTQDLLVEGFDGTIILVVFIFILVGSITLSIFLNTRKKRKKAAKKLNKQVNNTSKPQ